MAPYSRVVEDTFNDRQETWQTRPTRMPAESQPMPQILQAGGVVRDTVLLALAVTAKHASDTACNVGISQDIEQTALTELKLSSRYLLAG